MTLSIDLFLKLVYFIPNDDSVKETFSFDKKLKMISVSNKCIVSYDETSFLETQEETILLTIDFLFESKPDLKINRKDLQFFFQFAASQTNFLFNGNIMIKLIGLIWDHFSHLFLPVRFTGDITKYQRD